LSPSSSCCGFSSAETDGMGKPSFGGSGLVMVVLAEGGCGEGKNTYSLDMGRDEAFRAPSR
jgi:hypothetical protein